MKLERCADIVHVSDVYCVEIGRNCLWEPNVYVCTLVHSIDAAERTEELEAGEPMTIGDDIRIGGRAVIDPSVTIGSNAVVGSGAVVTEDVPAGVVVKSNPPEIQKTRLNLRQFDDRSSAQDGTTTRRTGRSARSSTPGRRERTPLRAS